MVRNSATLSQLRIETADNLVTEKTEVYARFIDWTFQTAKNFAVEVPSLRNISDLNGSGKSRRIVVDRWTEHELGFAKEVYRP
jgi:hypothetical protein